MLAVQASFPKQDPTICAEDFLGAQNTSPPLDSISFDHSQPPHPASTSHLVKPAAFLCETNFGATTFPAPWLEDGSFDHIDREDTPIFDFDSGASLPPNESPMTIHAMPLPQVSNSVSDDDLAHLHREFFSHIHSVMPIVSKAKFYKHLQEMNDDVAVKSVSYTIALLATTVPEVDVRLRNLCYLLARHHVDECESRDELGSLQRIDYLQALLLLTRFEINSRSCARAWLVLGRAVRLAKMMRLDQMDHNGAPCPSSVGLPEIQLSATNDVVELEERRRCLWALYVLEGLASVYRNSPGLLDDTSVRII